MFSPRFPPGPAGSRAAARPRGVEEDTSLLSTWRRRTGSRVWGGAEWEPWPHPLLVAPPISPHPSGPTHQAPPSNSKLNPCACAHADPRGCLAINHKLTLRGVEDAELLGMEACSLAAETPSPPCDREPSLPPQGGVYRKTVLVSRTDQRRARGRLRPSSTTCAGPL